VKIVVAVRTRNEESNIERFCWSYRDADAILVADGGSTDSTIRLANNFSNVIVRPFEELTQMSNGHVRNNDSDHTNFLMRWAREEQADFVLNDDCDSVPNYLLRNDYRRIIEETEANYLLAVRLYLWGTDAHFPNMAKPGADHNSWETSLWGWRGNQELSTVNVPPAFTFRIGDMDVHDFRNDAKTQEIFPPYCLLHHSWKNDEQVEQKLAVYRESGLIPFMLHPKVFAGPLEGLEDWMRINDD
jgi:hypothetical protein